jgi:hypothetical protein
MPDCEHIAEKNRVIRLLIEAVDILKKLEWSGSNFMYACCPICRGSYSYKHPLDGKDFGHTPDCRLAAHFKNVEVEDGE